MKVGSGGGLYLFLFFSKKCDRELDKYLEIFS